MKILVDSDACPAVIKKILFRAAERTGIEITLVANHPQYVPYSDNISLVLVSSGADVADGEIVKRTENGDLIVTSDIPLAALAIEKGAVVLSPRGELYTEENIKSRLSVRNFMEELRSGGVNTGGPPALSQSDRRRFAGYLDKFLTLKK
jgi:uncharacterized protein YaiI (UPF0178 family)